MLPGTRLSLRRSSGGEYSSSGAVLRDECGNDTEGLLWATGARPRPDPVEPKTTPQQPTNQAEYEPDQTAIKPLARSYSENMVAGPGFEPVPPTARTGLQVLKMNDFKGFKKRKSA